MSATSRTTPSTGLFLHGNDSRNDSRNDSETLPISAFATGLILEPGIVLVVFGNLLVLLSLRHHKKLIVTDILLFSLSLADFVAGVFPLQIVVFMNYFVQKPWTKPLCDVFVVMVNTLRYASAGTVTLIAIERTYLLVFPLKYHTTVTKTKARKVVILTWIVSLFFGILPIIGVGQSGFTHGQCLYQLSDLGEAYAVTVLTASFLLLLSVLICFVAIKLSGGRFIERQNVMVAAMFVTDASKLAFAMGMTGKAGAKYTRTINKTKGVKEVRRLTTMMSLVIVLYYTSWLPILINNVVTMIRKESSSKTVLLFTGMLSLLYSFSNPILYGKMSPRYLRGYKQVLGGLLDLCGWRPRGCTSASNTSMSTTAYCTTRGNTTRSKQHSKNESNGRIPRRMFSKSSAQNLHNESAGPGNVQTSGSHANPAIHDSLSSINANQEISKTHSRDFLHLSESLPAQMYDDTRL